MRSEYPEHLFLLERQMSVSATLLSLGFCHFPPNYWSQHVYDASKILVIQKYIEFKYDIGCSLFAISCSDWTAFVYSNWLAKNVDRGRCKALEVAPIRQEISRLKDLIMQETGAVDVQWQCNWNLRSHHTVLKGLLRICRQHASSINLEGTSSCLL